MTFFSSWLLNQVGIYYDAKHTDELTEKYVDLKNIERRIALKIKQDKEAADKGK